MESATPNNSDTLVIVTGATASGKTALAVELAQALGTEIISADSRQLYRDLTVGTAPPSADQLAAVPHHFVGTLALDQYYSAAQFEEDVMQTLPGIFSRCGSRAVMAGGSMMYIDAVCRGIDALPTVSEPNRRAAYAILDTEGLDGVIARLQQLDPEFLRTTPDLNNHKRLVHALEVTMQAGRPYSSLITGRTRRRPFRILKFAIDMPREELFDRINRRVDAMMEAGLLDEARRVYPLRHAKAGHPVLNALNTVGYKELFACFDGEMDLATAVARIQKNTRVYAKKQLTWLRRDPSVIWLPTSGPLLPAILSRL